MTSGTAAAVRRAVEAVVDPELRALLEELDADKEGGEAPK